MDFIFLNSKRAGHEDYGTVYARVRTKGINKKYSTGFTIKSHEWKKINSLNYSANNMMVSIGIKYGLFMTLITKIKHYFENDFDPDRVYEALRTIKNTVINAELVPTKCPRKSKKSMLLVDYLNQYIKEIESGARLKKGTCCKCSVNYTKNLMSLLSKIRCYEADKNINLTLDDVTMQFQREFMKWDLDNGLSPNTIRNNLVCLKTVMNVAFESKLTKGADFKLSEFIPKGVPAEHVYLNMNKIQQLQKLDVSSEEAVRKLIEKADLDRKMRDKLLRMDVTQLATRLEWTRDVFLVGCLCGQRFSDFSRINSSMIQIIDDNQFITLTQRKTQKKVVIPMDVCVGSILDKYNGMLPKLRLKQFNDYLKMIGRLMGWTYATDIEVSKLGNKKSNMFCDLISSHTARRSFATNAYMAGVPLGSIMSVTGHSSEKTLRIYLQQQAEEKAIVAAKDLEKRILNYK